VADSLIVEERSGFGLATVMGRKAVSPTALGNALGFSPPEGPARIKRDGIAWIGTGPATWLAMTDAPEIGWPASLEQRLKGLASISDQSGSYRIFRLAGDRARSLLQRGAFIDLHADAFPQGSVATTVIAHIGVVFWQTDDDPAAFEVATFRSYAPSFLRWLNATSKGLDHLPSRAMRF
jgi:heterotetrameric sarcosine oxidase gamma subunit